MARARQTVDGAARVTVVPRRRRFAAAANTPTRPAYRRRPPAKRRSVRAARGEFTSGYRGSGIRSARSRGGIKRHTRRCALPGGAIRRRNEMGRQLMEMRRLGGTGLVSSAIGLNGLAFARGCGPADRNHDLAVVGDALDSGITLIDVADCVRGGVEALVGRAVRRRRDEVVLATRGGARFTAQGQLVDVDGRPDRLARDCEASLRRLGVDHIDLYYLARVDPLVPIEDSIGGLAPAFQPETLARSGALIRAAQQVAAHKDVSLVRLALAWLLAQGPDVVVLPGTRSRTHLETDIAATDVALSDEECALLSALAAPQG